MMDENRVFPAFPTPVLNIVWPDADAVNAELTQVVLQRAGAPPEPGPWRSADDLLYWGGPAVNELTGWIRQAIGQIDQATNRAAPQEHVLQFFAWAQVFAPGDYQAVHDTAAHSWTGVYFVDAGDPAPDAALSAVLQLQDPRLGVTATTTPGDRLGEPILIRPRAGRMLVFPGWLPRMTHPYRGGRPVVVVGFNAHYVPAPPPDQA